MYPGKSSATPPPLPPPKPVASDTADNILAIAKRLYEKEQGTLSSASMRDCIHIAIEAAWLEAKFEIEIAKGTR